MDIHIIVGSVLGATEYVAEAAQSVLTEKGYSPHIHFNPDIKDIPTKGLWLVCSSTHGAGDLPDNIQAFAKQLLLTNLSEVKVLLIGLGDSSYDTYCGAAMQLESLLVKQGASLLKPAYCIDVLNHPIPENIACEWLARAITTP